MKFEMTEEVTGWTGKKVVRIKTKVILLLGAISIVLGIILLSLGKQWGGSLIFSSTLFFLYPLVRLFLGGQDSFLGVILTVLLDRKIKTKINSITTGDRKSRRR